MSYHKPTRQQRERRKIRKTIRLLEDRCCQFCVWAINKSSSIVCCVNRGRGLLWVQKTDNIPYFYIKNLDDCCDKFKRKNEKN